MKCECIYVDCDDPEFYNSSLIRAKKTHKCVECSRPILPGELYEYVAGKWNDEFSVYKTCTDCMSVRDAFFCTWALGALWEDFAKYAHKDECFGENILKCTDKGREMINKILNEEK